MSHIIADIGLNLANGKTARVNADRLRFSPYRCFPMNENEQELKCVRELAAHLQAQTGELAVYGASKFASFLLKHAPELRERIAFFVEDRPTETEFEGKPLRSFEAISGAKTVFVAQTSAFKIMRADYRLGAFAHDGGKVITPMVLPELSTDIVPRRAWIPFVETIYPVAVPDIQLKEGVDLVMVDCPARNLSLMPNGVGYVYNALKNAGINFQALDLDIIAYHRFHVHRLLDGPSEIKTHTGRVMPDDPWQAENYELWENPDVSEYFNPEMHELVNEIVRVKPKILALSVQQCNVPFSVRVVRAVRKQLPDIKVIVGGFSCYQSSVGLKAFPDTDYMCIAEADCTIGPLVKAILAGEKPKNMPGVMSYDDDADWKFKPAPMPNNLDEIEIPKYEWTDIGLYRNFNHYQLVPVIASRGCRWSLCTFCAERFFWRIRSPKNFVDELEWFADQGSDLFMFNESDLNGKPELLLEICDEVIRRRLKVRLTGQLRINKQSDRKFFDKLVEAGFTALRFGVDGWSKGSMKLQKKGYTPEIVTQNLKDCNDAGIFNEVNMVIGVPGETDQDITESIELLVENKDNIGRVANINPLMLVLGSVYWEKPEEFNIHFRGNRDELYSEYPHVIPPDLWYSEGPYIDKDVRWERFVRIVRALDKHGFDIGPFAKQVITDVEAGKGAEVSTMRHTLHEEDEEQESTTEANVGRTKMLADSAGETTGIDPNLEEFNGYILKHKGRFYGISESPVLVDTFEERLKDNRIVHHLRRLRAKHMVFESMYVFGRQIVRKTAGLRQNWARERLKKTGTKVQADAAAAPAGNGTEQVADPFQLLFSNPGAIAYVADRMPDETIALVREAFYGFNIIRIGSELLVGLKQGLPLDFKLMETETYPEGAFFRGATYDSVEQQIVAHVVSMTPDTGAHVLNEDFYGYSIVREDGFLKAVRLDQSNPDVPLTFTGDSIIELEKAVLEQVYIERGHGAAHEEHLAQADREVALYQKRTGYDVSLAR